MLPMQPGLLARRNADYIRNGTTTLFAALNIATGQVTGLCQPRHGLWEPYDGRLSRTVLREPEGETPSGYSPSASRSETGSRRTPASTCTSPRRRRRG